MRFKFLIASLCLFGVALVVLILWSNSRIGRPLDSYRGVPVYDNGLLFFRSYGKNYSKDGYYWRVVRSPGETGSWGYASNSTRASLRAEPTH